MNKLKKFVSAVALVSIALPIIPVGASTSSKYYSWKRTVLPIISRTANDYASLQIDLGNGNAAGSTADLNSLGNDARAINSHANSPDYTLNLKVNALALSLANLSSVGRSTLNGGSLSNWKSALVWWSRSETAFSNRLAYDNNRW